MSLLEGLDETSLILRHRDEIDAYQTRIRADRPWVFSAKAIPVATDAGSTAPINVATKQNAGAEPRKSSREKSNASCRKNPRLIACLCMIAMLASAAPHPATAQNAASRASRSAS